MNQLQWLRQKRQLSASKDRLNLRYWKPFYEDHFNLPRELNLRNWQRWKTEERKSFSTGTACRRITESSHFLQDLTNKNLANYFICKIMKVMTKRYYENKQKDYKAGIKWISWLINKRKQIDRTIQAYSTLASNIYHSLCNLLIKLFEKKK